MCTESGLDELVSKITIPNRAHIPQNRVLLLLGSGAALDGRPRRHHYNGCPERCIGRKRTSSASRRTTFLGRHSGVGFLPYTVTTALPNSCSKYGCSRWRKVRNPMSWLWLPKCPAAGREDPGRQQGVGHHVGHGCVPDAPTPWAAAAYSAPAMVPAIQRHPCSTPNSSDETASDTNAKCRRSTAVKSVDFSRCSA